MTRTPEHAAALAAALAGVAAGLAALLRHRTGLALLDPILILCVYALAVAAIAWGRARLAHMAGLEEREAARAAQDAARSSLFDADSTDLLPAVRAFRQAERFAVPALPLLLALVFGAWTWSTWNALDPLRALPRDPLFAAAALGGLAFPLFLLSRYLIGLARDPAHRLARAPGIALGLASLAALAGSAAAVAVHAEWPNVDLLAARALTVLPALLAAESAALFIAGLYAPRGKNRAAAAPYESRLAALATDPATWARSLATSFDYQFGGVHERASTRFLKRALLPLLLFQLAVLYLLSSLIFLGPEEAGIRERLGRPVPGGPMESGFHLLWPWPFETVRREPARRVLSIHVGYEKADGERHPETLLWTVPHFRNEDTFLTAGEGEAAGDATSVGLLSFNMPVEFLVTNLHQYVYGHRDPPGLVRDLAYQSLTRALAARTLVDLLGAGRLAAGEEVRAGVQAAADRLGLGIKVLFAGVHGVHPPVPVADAFQSVVGALEEREASILEARAYTNTVLPLAHADAGQLRAAAEARRHRTAVLATADAALFTNRLAARRSAPTLFDQDLYYDTLSRALAGNRRYIIDHAGAREVLSLNLERKPYTDLFELAAPADKDTQP